MFSKLINIAYAQAQQVDVGSVTNLTIVIKRIMNTAGGLILTISAALFMWAAVQFLSAASEGGKIDKAKTTILYATVGIVVSLIAFSLPNLIVNLLQ